MGNLSKVDIATESDICVANSLELPCLQLAELRLMWKHAGRVDTHAIGFLPLAAFDRRAAQGRIEAVYRNAELVGWAMWAPSSARLVLKLYQIWVRPDARVVEHGRALCARLAERMSSERCAFIEAWVAEDLPANAFWRAIGFVATNWRYGRGEFARRHLRWVWPPPSHCLGLVRERESAPPLAPRS